MKNHLINILLFTVVFALLAGCDKPSEKARVNIVYEQLANFSEYKLSPDASSSTGAGNGMFVQYKINQISNTGSQAVVFVFDKHKIVAVAPDKTSNEEPSGDNILLGSKLANNVTVQPGEVKSNVGCIIKHVFTNNPQALANTSALVDLIHQLNSAQPVSMKREQGDTTTALVIDALPTALQNLCGN